jgi:hypothetical protein
VGRLRPGSTRFHSDDNQAPAASLVVATTAKKTNRGPLMPRCPLCRSALVTIGFGLYPIATCTSCNASWIQDGHQQRAINQVEEPTLFASAR